MTPPSSSSRKTSTSRREHQVPDHGLKARLATTPCTAAVLPHQQPMRPQPPGGGHCSAGSGDGGIRMGQSRFQGGGASMTLGPSIAGKYLSRAGSRKG